MDSRAIYSDHQTGCMFKSYELKLNVFVFSGRFHELLPKVFGFQADFNGSYDSLNVLEI